jgi:hypothetical protein
MDVGLGGGENASRPERVHRIQSWMAARRRLALRQHGQPAYDA